MENIGRYKIKSELGRGGMATVYQANDPSFERYVAIKVLPEAFLHDPQFRARFEREAKMIAALEHSAIVPVYDFGEENGQPFIVMRMMAGGSLADKINEGKLTIEEAAQVVTRVASALDAAHQKGIIHRDLKPGNILFDQYNNAFLSDFGIARLSEASAALTGSNILGTPAYMSPEQVQGDMEIDGRSDIYALGVIFYQMLVGNTPYQATTPAKVMMMHILEPVPNMMNMLPDVSPSVEAWYEKALAKDPNDRFSTAGEMAAALNSAVHSDTESYEKSPVSPQPKTQLGQTIVVPTDRTGQVTPSRGTPPPSTLTPMATNPAVAYQAPPRSRMLPAAIMGLALFGIIAIGLMALVFLGFSGSGPLAMLAPVTATQTTQLVVLHPSDTATLDVPTETSVPSPTESPVEVLPSDTPELIVELVPTATATKVLPSNTPKPTLTPTSDALVIGGADKIAFVDNNEIWVMNVDGSDLKQLTNDGAEKFRLGWTPDGVAVTYISGKCIWSIEYENKSQDFIACFETANSIDDFSISSDGTQAAVTLNQNLFVVPFERERLAQARFPSDLIEMGECEALSPLKTGNGTNVIVNQVRWSADDTKMAINVVAPINGIQSDLIRFTDVSDCQYADLLDEFPSRRLEVEDYDKYPYIQNFGYDGYYLFSLVSYGRNDGYGHLYLYNTDLHRSDNKVNPIEGKCCYRDPQFSPDGRYIIFAYQPYEAGATTVLYYVLYGSLGTGGNLEPIPLPDDFFNNPKVKPQPVLRPVEGQ